MDAALALFAFFPACDGGNVCWRLTTAEAWGARTLNRSMHAESVASCLARFRELASVWGSCQRQFHEECGASKGAHSRFGLTSKIELLGTIGSHVSFGTRKLKVQSSWIMMSQAYRVIAKKCAVLTAPTPHSSNLTTALNPRNSHTWHCINFVGVLSQPVRAIRRSLGPLCMVSLSLVGPYWPYWGAGGDPETRCRSAVFWLFPFLRARNSQKTGVRGNGM